MNVRDCGCFFLLFSLGACGSGKPSESDAEKIFRSHIDGGKDSPFQLESFKKTDGVPSEVAGIPYYTMTFEAKGQFKDNAFFGNGAIFGMEGTELNTLPYRRVSSLEEMGLGSQGFRSAFHGDRLQINGEIQFQKRESGWQPQALSFKYVQDSTGRVGNVSDTSETTPVSGSLSSDTAYIHSGMEQADHLACRQGNNGPAAPLELGSQEWVKLKPNTRYGYLRVLPSGLVCLRDLALFKIESPADIDPSINLIQAMSPANDEGLREVGIANPSTNYATIYVINPSTGEFKRNYPIWSEDLTAAPPRKKK